MSGLHFPKVSESWHMFNLQGNYVFWPYFTVAVPSCFPASLLTLEKLGEGPEPAAEQAFVTV